VRFYDEQTAYVVNAAHCPTCDAEKGQSCVREYREGHGNEREPHVARVKRAARIAIDGAVLIARIEQRPGSCLCGAPWSTHDVDRRKSTVIITCPGETP
jgi:hypothetical protein